MFLSIFTFVLIGLLINSAKPPVIIMVIVCNYLVEPSLTTAFMVDSPLAFGCPSNP